jgi:hypothetical protein
MLFPWKSVVRTWAEGREKVDVETLKEEEVCGSYL